MAVVWMVHFIRHYFILSAFHGLDAPDGVETPSAARVATVLFDLQGTLFGEYMVSGEVQVRQV